VSYTAIDTIYASKGGHPGGLLKNLMSSCLTASNVHNNVIKYLAVLGYARVRIVLPFPLTGLLATRERGGEIQPERGYRLMITAYNNIAFSKTESS
jgi:hypothetical protein